MRHLILTRVALGSPDENWLNSRSKIFEDLCAPSLTAQSCKDFIWVLALNYNTPGWFTERIKKAAPFAKFVYSDSKNIYPDWRQLIPDELLGNVLLTTRLDSDDALHKNFVEEVQKAAKKQKHSCALDAVLGYKLNQLTLDCFEVKCESNHFISLIEFGTSQTAFRCNHMEISNKFPVVSFCADKPLWVEGFHGGNVLNKEPRYGKRVYWDEVKKDFMDGA